MKLPLPLIGSLAPEPNEHFIQIALTLPHIMFSLLPILNLIGDWSGSILIHASDAGGRFCVLILFLSSPVPAFVVDAAIGVAATVAPAFAFVVGLPFLSFLSCLPSLPVVGVNVKPPPLVAEDAGILVAGVVVDGD